MKNTNIKDVEPEEENTNNSIEETKVETAFQTETEKNIQEELSKDSLSQNINNTNNQNNNISYCFNCGTKIEPDWKFCGNCGAELINNQKQTNNTQENEDNKSYAPILFILGYILAIAYAFFTNDTKGIYIALIIIITGKITYPKNTIIKILFWLSIIAFIALIVFSIWLIVSCFVAIQNCPG